MEKYKNINDVSTLKKLLMTYLNKMKLLMVN